VPCAGAYVITQQGAKMLLQKALPAKTQLDQQVALIDGLRRSALTPALAQRQDISETNTSNLHNVAPSPDQRALKDMPGSGYLQKFLNGGHCLWCRRLSKYSALRRKSRKRTWYGPFRGGLRSNRGRAHLSWRN